MNEDMRLILDKIEALERKIDRLILEQTPEGRQSAELASARSWAEGGPYDQLNAQNNQHQPREPFGGCDDLAG